MSSLVSDDRTALLHDLQSLAGDIAAETSDRLLTASQVALLFEVSERTIRIWANKKRIPAIHTPSGRWKFSAREMMSVYKASMQSLQEYRLT